MELPPLGPRSPDRGGGAGEIGGQPGLALARGPGAGGVVVARASLSAPGDPALLVAVQSDPVWCRRVRCVVTAAHPAAQFFLCQSADPFLVGAGAAVDTDRDLDAVGCSYPVTRLGRAGWGGRRCRALGARACQ